MRLILFFALATLVATSSALGQGNPRSAITQPSRQQFRTVKYAERVKRVLNHTTELRNDEKNSQDPEKLALGQCEDTNVNFFLPIVEAQSLVPAVVGTPVVTPLFGGDTSPLNVAHFHCATASIGGRPPAAVNFVLIRLGLSTTGHYVLHVMTDSRPFQPHRTLGVLPRIS